MTFKVRYLGGSNVKTLLGCVLVGLLAAPVSLAAGSDQTLEVSLAYIRDQLAAEGKLTYAVNMHDNATGQNWSNTMTGEASNVSTDVPLCRLSFHWTTSVDGGTKQELDTSLDFADARKVVVISRQQEVHKQVITAGHPTWVGTVSPPLWVVTTSFRDKSARVFNFPKKDVADRVAHTIGHVIDLCGAHK
jgi:hypothetical protein